MDRIGTVGHDDRDSPGRVHSRCGICGIAGNDDVHAEPDQVCSKRWQPFQLPIGIAILDHDILTNAIAETPETSLKRSAEMKLLLSGRDRERSHPVDWACGRLTVRREGTSSSRT